MGSELNVIELVVYWLGGYFFNSCLLLVELVLDLFYLLFGDQQFSLFVFEFLCEHVHFFLEPGGL